MEHISNGFTTQLDGAIDNSQTTMLVDSVTGAPTPPFRLVIEDEIVIVTNISTLTLTITRGAESTTAASHADNTSVTNELTAGGLVQQSIDNAGIAITSDLFASRPSPGTPNRLYLPTDSPIWSLDNGANWLGYGPIYPLKPIDNTAFSWVNQGSSTITQFGDAWTLYAPPNTTDSFRIRVKSLAYSTNYTAIGAFLPTQTNINWSRSGMVLRESSSGKIVVITFVGDTTMPLYIQHWTTPSSGNTNIVGPVNIGLTQNQLVRFIKIVDDGTNRKISISNDMISWIQVYSVTRTNHITPDQIGFLAGPDWGNTVGTYLTMLSLTETSP